MRNSERMRLDEVPTRKLLQYLEATRKVAPYGYAVSVLERELDRRRWLARKRIERRKAVDA